MSTQPSYTDLMRERDRHAAISHLSSQLDDLYAAYSALRWLDPGPERVAAGDALRALRIRLEAQMTTLQDV